MPLDGIPDFDLCRPYSVAAAVTAASVPGAVYAAGCTDLIPRLRDGAGCGTLVSLEAVTELRQIGWDGSTLTIGAAVDHDTGAHHPAVTAALPGLAMAWRQIANHRVRLRATIGGNIMARQRRYELPVLLAAAGARLNFAVPGGQLVLLPADLWHQPAPPGALLQAVTIPRASELWLGYDRSLRPSLTVAVAVRGETVRLAAGPGNAPPALATASVADDPGALTTLLPGNLGDAETSEEYRRHAIGVLASRLLDSYRSGREQRG